MRALEHKLEQEQEQGDMRALGHKLELEQEQDGMRAPEHKRELEQVGSKVLVHDILVGSKVPESMLVEGLGSIVA